MNSNTGNTSKNKLNVRYWYFGIFPVFVCSAASEVFLGVTGPLIGLLGGFLMMRFAPDIRNSLGRWAIAIGGSLAFAFVTSVIQLPSAPISSPYFYRSQLIAQAIIAGIGGLIFYFIFVGILWWWQRKNQSE